MTEHCSAFA